MILLYYQTNLTSMVQELRYMTVDSQVTLPLDDIITLVLTDEVLEEATSALFEITKKQKRFAV